MAEYTWLWITLIMVTVTAVAGILFYAYVIDDGEDEEASGNAELSGAVSTPQYISSQKLQGFILLRGLVDLRILFFSKTNFQLKSTRYRVALKLNQLSTRVELKQSLLRHDM